MSIELVDVHKAFGPKKILRGLTLEVLEGQTVSLVGFSGAGKSLTLKHIAGLMTPDRGSIRVDGHSIPDLSRQDLYRLRLDMGYVFQFAALFDSMTIAENLSMGLIKKGGMSDAQIRERVAESLDRVGLSGFQDRYPSEMSGGQQKRAGLARAIAYRPKYLLYDEPTSGLDPVTTEVIDRLILKMKEDLGVTSLVITHDMKSAYNISDRIAMLWEGRVVEQGTPEEFQRSTHPLVRGFVEGRPEMIEDAQRQMAEDAANGGDGHPGRGHGSQGRHA